MLGAFDMADFCIKTAGILQYIGWVLTIVKISIPIIIIFLGILDLGKAVVASKDDEIKTATKRLLWRAVAGVAIFFVPTIVIWLFGTIDGYNSATNAGGGFGTCSNCLLTPWDGCQ